jgi:signal transduction histidine kinase
MTGIVNSGEVSFEPRARLLKLLGGELIRDDTMAVVELVKNAHDADASLVKLEFRSTRDGSGEILIEDDGNGMNLENFMSGWMQPAGSQKRKKKYHYTRKRRRVLGEKGVGRFAVDRLGGQLELISRARRTPNEVVANFDWDEFDDGDRPLSEITSAWSERRPRLFKNRYGTQLRIRGLRSRWTERNFRKLHSKLKRLVSPFGNGHDFEIKLTSDEFPDYSGTMETSFLDRAPHSITADFNGEDTIDYRFRDGTSFSRNWEGAGELACGPVSISLHSFDLEQEKISRIGSRVDVRAWLREWSGVSIYRDGYRVLPYGEPDDDWLRLDQRRVNNPVVCLSNNQVCGFIEVTTDRNPYLRDQTNRGGLIQSRALDDLRALALAVFSVLEAKRQEIRNPDPLNERDESASGQLEFFEKNDILNRTAALLTGRDDKIDGASPNSQLQREFNDIFINAEKKARERMECYLELAGVGQIASHMSRPLEHRMQVMKEIIELLREVLGREGSPDSSGPLELTDRISDELKSCVGIISRSTGYRKNPKSSTDVIRELSHFSDSVAWMLSEHEVNFEIEADGVGLAFLVFFRAEALEQVLHILLRNSLDAFEGSRVKKKRICIKLARRDDGKGILEFADNAGGISENFREKIFNPGFTLGEKKRGMGLTVAKELLRFEDGDIVLGRRGGNRSMTRFAITLNLKNPRLIL